jgi:hypothetical protein
MSNKYAVIENDKVVNNVVSEPEHAAEQGWILMPEGVGIGWAYINGDFINENIPILDEKAKIKTEIAKLEDSVTPRRQREAILAIDTTWLADIEIQIGQLRQQLAEL